MKKTLLPLLACAAILLSGCASIQNSYDGYDISRIDPFIEVNKTTADELRALLGTPTMTATDKDGNQILGFALVGNRPGGAYGRNIGKAFATLGFGSKTYEVTSKNAIFKLNDLGVVTDFKSNGWAWLQKNRFTFWIECDRRLTEEEMNKAVNYTVDEIQRTYAEAAAAEKGIPVDAVDVEEEFEWCNIPCHTVRGAVEAFGPLSNVVTVVEEKPGDGSKFHLIYPGK